MDGPYDMFLIKGTTFRLFVEFEVLKIIFSKQMLLVMARPPVQQVSTKTFSTSYYIKNKKPRNLNLWIIPKWFISRFF